MKEYLSGYIRESESGLMGFFLEGISWIVIILTFPFSLLVCFKVSNENKKVVDNILHQVVTEYERAVIFKLGRLKKGGSLGPGLHFELPCIEHVEVVDMRTSKMKVPPQEILTKDNVTVTVDAVVFYRVSNATISVANVEDSHHSTKLLAQTTLRNVLGTKNLHEILSQRESISNNMQVQE